MERQLYIKYIGGEPVISYCTSLYIDGHWTSNPTPEQIAQDGWLPYTPPEPQPYVPEPQNTPYESDTIEAIKKMFAPEIGEMSDKEALDVAALFPTWHSMLGKAVAKDERYWDDGKLWKVLQPHTVSAEWRPKDAVSLFVEVTVEEWPEIPENILAENAWMQGDKGTWHGQHYISLIDNNVWNPDQYPAAWQLAE